MPRLIAIGGYPGAGKSTAARRLARELHIPRLGSDYLGRTIRKARPDISEPHRLGFSVLFALTDDFLNSNCSVIVDTNMGWEFQWERLDDIAANRHATFIPIILRCDQNAYLQRIAERHKADPTTTASVEQMQQLSHFARLCEFLDALHRTDVHNVDANGTPDETYERIKAIVSPPADYDSAGSG